MVDEICGENREEPVKVKKKNKVLIGFLIFLFATILIIFASLWVWANYFPVQCGA